MKIDLNHILTAIITALALYIGSTVYSLDKEVTLLNYQMEQVNKLLQDLYDTKSDK